MIPDTVYPLTHFSHEDDAHGFNSFNASFDFAKVFDDEFKDAHHHDQQGSFMNLFGTSGPMTMSSVPNPLQSSFSVPAPAVVADAPGSIHNISPPHAAQQPASSRVDPLINVIMVVDPVTQKVICPKQVLTFEVDGKMEKTVFGPIALDAIPKDTIANFSQHVVSGSEVAQAPAATQFKPISPGTTCDGSSSQYGLPIAPMTTASAPQQQVSGKVSPSNSSIGSGSAASSNNKESSTTTAVAAPPTPLRALSAYNFFFRDERDRIINDSDQDFTSEKERRLLTTHWNQDRNKKRRHRKTHGKIDFTTLSKLISSRWKELSAEHKEFYRNVAAKDWDRYQRELAEYKKGATSSVGPMSISAAFSSSNFGGHC